jgi:hypothetical protein
MKPSPISVAMVVVSLLFAPALLAQSPDSANQTAASPAPSASAAEVPRLIKFSGTLLDALDRPMAGTVGVTFALYSQQTGGASLWLETQNVKPDASGVYTVLLGANSANGVPAELFASGEARWLAVQVERQAEQPRVLLVSVPYALKAKDAETLGGKPASAFVTTETLAGAGTPTGGSAAASSSTASTALPGTKAQTTTKKAASTPPPATACTNVTSDGTAIANSISLFTTACNVESSVISQVGSNVGIGTAAPAVALDIVGNNAGLRLSGTGTHQVTVTGLSSGRLGQDANGFFFASDTNGKTVRFLTNNGTLNEWMRITSAGNVGIGTTTPGAKLEIAGGNLALPNTTSGGTAGVVTLGGVPFLHNFGPTNAGNTFMGVGAGNFSLTGTDNTAAGASALNADTTGSFNSAFGDSALFSHRTGNFNAAFGAQALFSDTTGFNNSAFGTFVLFANTTGDFNSAFGASALAHNTTGVNNSAFGDFALNANTITGNNVAMGNGAMAAFNSTNGGDGFNVGIGVQALNAETTGFANVAVGHFTLATATSLIDNTAIGYTALANGHGNDNTGLGAFALHDVTGSGNIALGSGAGLNLTTSSNNIDIGSGGVAGESNTIRIGTQGTQTAAFMSGVNGATSASGVAVLVNSSGQLGTVTSSRRFKNDIANMGGESDLLMKLRPVAFYYKPEYDKTHTRQYGLVAEEVAQVAPQLVVFDKDGAPETVRYHFVNAMLLNEVQKQQDTIARQQAEIEKLAARLAKLEALAAPAPLGR